MNDPAGVQIHNSFFHESFEIVKKYRPTVAKEEAAKWISRVINTQMAIGNSQDIPINRDVVKIKTGYEPDIIGEIEWLIERGSRAVLACPTFTSMLMLIREKVETNRLEKAAKGADQRESTQTTNYNDNSRIYQQQKRDDYLDPSEKWRRNKLQRQKEGLGCCIIRGGKLSSKFHVVKSWVFNSVLRNTVQIYSKVRL